MHSPFEHSLFSATIYKHYPGIKEKPAGINFYLLITWIVFIGNLPNLDFVFSRLKYHITGKSEIFVHRGIFHSLFSCTLLALFLSAKKPKEFQLKNKIYSFWFYFLLLNGHLLLDYISLDTNSPVGIKLFYPFTNTYFSFSTPILKKFHYASMLEILSLINLKNIIWNSTLLIIFYSLVSGIKYSIK